jgi:hypothetical protein
VKILKLLMRSAIILVTLAVLSFYCYMLWIIYGLDIPLQNRMNIIYFITGSVGLLIYWTLSLAFNSKDEVASK